MEFHVLGHGGKDGVLILYAPRPILTIDSAPFSIVPGARWKPWSLKSGCKR